MNSLKMKIAVILGVSHMSLGILLKGINARYFYSNLDFYFEFIPQFVLLLVTFGYMDLLIILKWLTYYQNTADAPSIVAFMIDMMLTGGDVKQTPLVGNKDSHRIVNIIILTVALLCIPTMLLVKPIILTQEIKKKEASKRPGAIELGVCSFKKRKMSDDMSDPENQSDSDEEESKLIKRGPQARKRFGNDQDRRSQVYSPGDDPYSIEEKKDEARERLVDATDCYKTEKGHDLQEIWIHQLIETIEFVLGTISNTASYLRLWALSLAHSQLSEVFYDKLIRSGVEKGNWVIIFFTLPFFITANFFILILMDSME